MAEVKVWLISGASRGIGLALARRVVAAGDRAILLARGESVHEAAGELGENAMGIQADVADRGSVEHAIATAHEAFGQLDCVVNNAD